MKPESTICAGSLSGEHIGTRIAFNAGTDDDPVLITAALRSVTHEPGKAHVRVRGAVPPRPIIGAAVEKWVLDASAIVGLRDPDLDTALAAALRRREPVA